MDVLYICDRKKSCATSDRCGKECRFTTDPKHAVNGACRRPYMHMERFRIEADVGRGMFYVEKEKTNRR